MIVAAAFRNPQNDVVWSVICNARRVRPEQEGRPTDGPKRMVALNQRMPLGDFAAPFIPCRVQGVLYRHVVVRICTSTACDRM